MKHSPVCLIALSLMLSLAACGADAEPEAGADTEAATGEEMAAAEFGEDFEERACEYFTEDELREIFDIPADTELEKSRSTPCSYTWTMPHPDQPGVTPEFMAGVSYVIAVADDMEGAASSFEAAAGDRSAEEMTALAEDAAETAAEGSELSEEQRQEVRESAGEMFGQALDYETLEGVGDRAAWESTHGSLVVQAGNLVFRTMAQSNYWDGEAGEVRRQNYPNLAAEVARATLN